MPCSSKITIPTKRHIDSLKRLLIYFDSQTQISKALGISRQTVNDWFNARKVISIENAMRLENMLQKRVTLHDLRPDIEKLEKKDKKVLHNLK